MRILSFTLSREFVISAMLLDVTMICRRAARRWKCGESTESIVHKGSPLRSTVSMCANRLRTKTVARCTIVPCCAVIGPCIYIYQPEQRQFYDNRYSLCCSFLYAVSDSLNANGWKTVEPSGQNITDEGIAAVASAASCWLENRQPAIIQRTCRVSAPNLGMLLKWAPPGIYLFIQMSVVTWRDSVCVLMSER